MWFPWQANLSCQIKTPNDTAWRINEKVIRYPASSFLKAIHQATKLTWILVFLGTTAGAQSASIGAAGEARIAVFRLGGTDLPEGGSSWLSELIQQEVAKADSVGVIEQLLEPRTDLTDVAAAAREVGASLAITGRVAVVADLFVVDLLLINATTGAVMAETTVEVVDSPLDPRMAVRAAAQRLIGIGGHETLPESFISVSSTPPGAKVFVGGLMEGKAPVKVRVPPGGHDIKATLPGYNAWALGVDVKRGETISINAALASTLSATQSKSDGGDILLAFSVPYAAVMGQGLLYLAQVKSGRPYIGWLLVAPPATYLIASDAIGNAEIGIGRAWIIMSSGLWGATWGALGVGTSGLDELRPYVAVSVATSALGLMIATNVTKGREVSRKRVNLINTGGFMGSAVGLGLPYLMDVSEGRVYSVGLLVGGIVGITLATELTSGLEFVPENGSASVSLAPEIRLTGNNDLWENRSHLPASRATGMHYGMRLQLRFK